MNYSYSDFDPKLLSFPVDNQKWITFPSNHRLFRLLVSYIASNMVNKSGGFYADILPAKCSDENPLRLRAFDRVKIKIGYGEYEFRGLQGETFRALYQHVGKPVGTGCGVSVMENLLIFSPSLETIADFISEIVRLSEKPEHGKFVCFTWNIQNMFWREDVRVNNRPMESVVLPTEIKNRLVNDLEKFLSIKTKDFYLRNGIPYRRSYLFYGIPGTGKTSMVQALAGHFKRNVCYLLPTHPEMTDDNLREAIHQIPQNSIVVFEDIDSLFDRHRDNKNTKSCLTFSGLLNGLDGITSPNGQIFILTTNLRDHLDHALIRNGRVDLHVEFSYANEEQIEQMWKNFYPDGIHLAKEFSTKVMDLLTENHLSVTTSTLQHFFITQMDATAEEALEQAETIIEEILRNSSEAMLEAAMKNANENSEEGGGGDEVNEEAKGPLTAGKPVGFPAKKPMIKRKLPRAKLGDNEPAIDTTNPFLN
jgi:chaperone BCS1